jgi:hypothetical protein
VHAFHPDVRRLVAAAVAAFMLTIAALALPSAAGDLQLGLGGGSEGAPGAASPVVVRPAPSQPRWVADPLSPPAFTIR